LQAGGSGEAKNPVWIDETFRRFGALHRPGENIEDSVLLRHRKQVGGGPVGGPHIRQKTNPQRKGKIAYCLTGESSGQLNDSGKKKRAGRLPGVQKKEGFSERPGREAKKTSSQE